MLKLPILFILPALASCFLFGRDQSNWNGLKVTWGLDPFSSFQSMPRTRAAALSSQWVSLNPGGCSDNPKFMGERFIKSGDYGVILIFDVAGYIAGIQIGWPANFNPNPNNYPFGPLTNSPVVKDNGYHYVTAYFVDPSTICNGGRNACQFHTEGTGTGLWIQNGTNPVAHSITIPKTVADADASKWNKGACFVTMGFHYWYDMSKNMNCDNFYPVFLLYNGGVLNGFGWALAMDLKNYSTRIEHPPQSSYGHFMTPPPDCLSTLGTVTTLHVYLTDSPTANKC
ncbi:uncharacterized protein LOC132752700 isoform X2 [Ruditapes philippinarum]|uniref:uncharacterized protein LOC132752700 isoform X2 n=1 Tax=Ruditapes philippinarum TaxID=129788 RepID=UPI00295ACC48|nr:uncharacterized protein LOC132752700 isoform X2 [Ruditapes philippinarum]